jgi:aerobic carbon-monoxide dehydrogenase small subunit
MTATDTVLETTVAGPDGTVPVALTVNGTRERHEVEPRTLLVDLLRDTLGLTGAKVGCDTGQCGACVVSLDGRSVKSCGVLAVQVDGSAVRTVEEGGPDAELDPLQDALWAEHGSQCGFCTPGVVMSLRDLLAQHPDPDEAQVRAWLDGTLCRCTGYLPFLRAVRTVASGPGGVR